MSSFKNHPTPRWAALVAAALVVALPAAGFAAKKSQKTQAHKPAAQTTQKAQAAPAGGFLPSAPPPRGPENEESEEIEMRSAREWQLLTYPTGKLPSQPWDRARKWVSKRVADAAPWQGPGLRSPYDTPDRDGGIWEKSLIAPGTNTWVAYGPQGLDTVGTTNNAYRYGITAGRVAEGGLAVDPNNPGVAYAAFAAGGLWKTTSLGLPAVTWTPLWDGKDFVTQAASAIEIDPTNSNVLYVGTGDWSANDQFGAGIMKSTDGGATWTQLGASVFTPYSTTHPAGGNRWSNQNIRVIQVDPRNPNNVLVGTRYDLYISHDAGSSWQICGFGNGYTDPSASNATVKAVNRIGSIYLDSRGANTVAYVAVGYYGNNGNGDNGVYRFTVPSTGCPAWPSDFTTLFGGFPANTGNGINANATGGSTTGRIELAGATGPDGKLTLYAQVSEAVNTTVDGTYVLRPDGGSTTWTKLTGSTSTAYKDCANGSSNTGQDWYDLFIAVDSSDDKTLYIGHIDAFKATVNSTYTSMTVSDLTNVYATTCPSYGKVHPDQHAFAFVPGTSGSTFLLGNDGGVYYNNNRGDVAAWKQLNNSFNTNQFYAGQIGADFAGSGIGGVQWVFGGMQDNGNSSWDSRTADLTATGRSVGGDGFFTTFDPIGGGESTGWWITEYTYGSLYCSSSGADGPFSSSRCGPRQTGSADWSAPLMLDTLHCTNAQCRNYVFGEDYVHASGAYNNFGPSWTRVSPLLSRTTSGGSIIALNLAPSNPKSAVAGTSDGKVWWTETLYTGTACTQAAANTSTFACSPNGSAVWRDVDSTNAVLPNRAILGVASDPADHTLIYAAVGGFNENTPTTPGHLFQFKWNGTAWTRVNKTGNLPNVPAAAVAVNPLNRKQVFVGTYFGFYYTDDVDAATPVWVRYQWGLPNTVIRYLTVDRGPGSNPLLGTTLAAFTYGRGVYAIKLPTGGASFPAHP
ncbi:MAG TPA: hypothetical protein VHC97_00005 [Thermoanaerobaculia bacterium]|jgi:hypothetical protein|nr:hypothetical protein [Thermoanaerobaculia bacterium]